MTTSLLIIAKEPRPGRVKTRLSPHYSPTEAARLAQAALSDTLHLALRLPVERRILVLEGVPGSWLPAGFEVVAQRGSGLDERLAHAFTSCGGPSLLVGMDTPQATAADLAPALEPHAWDETDAWFGPAVDGGFWALGLVDPRPELLLGIPMSTQDTGRRQRDRLVEAGLRVGDLVELRDVDTAQDVTLVAAAAPDSRFARTAAAIGAGRDEQAVRS